MDPKEFEKFARSGYVNPLVPTPAPIRPNVRAALDYLDNILSRGGQDAEDLWDVLSALRGPDDNQDPWSRHYDGAYLDSKKKDVTIPIRRAALPLTARDNERARSDRDAYRSVNGARNGVHTRASFGRGDCRYAGLNRESSEHFLSHGYRAAKALGLI